jgi:hypothetical protein
MIDVNDLTKEHNTSDDTKKKSTNSIFTKIKHYFYPSSNYNHNVKIYNKTNIKPNNQSEPLLSKNDLNIPLHTIYEHELNSYVKPKLTPLLCPTCYGNINICNNCNNYSSSSKKNKHLVLHKPNILNGETSPKNKNVVRFDIETRKINYFKLKPLLCSICFEYKNKCICSIFSSNKILNNKTNSTLSINLKINNK